MVDWICDYHARVEDLPVRSQVRMFSIRSDGAQVMIDIEDDL